MIDRFDDRVHGAERLGQAFPCGAWERSKEAHGSRLMRPSTSPRAGSVSSRIHDHFALDVFSLKKQQQKNALLLLFKLLLLLRAFKDAGGRGICSF